MQKITTHLWFDKEAKEAAEFYVSVFPDSKILSSGELHDTPSGDVQTLTIEVAGHQFGMISAGPLFKFNPSISFLFACDSKEQVEELWNKLIDGGQSMMELGEYPFSEKYGWVADKYGLSWQLMYNPDAPQKVTPTLMFVGDKAGKCEEAVNFYTSVFKDSKVGDSMRYEKGEEPEQEGTIKHIDFVLENQHFSAMDSARMHNFDFNEAVSLMVHCKDQDELDYYWDKLTAVPESEQCGWLKDKYGVSWQIVPDAMDEMMAKSSPQQMAAVTQAFLKMKKFDIAKLQEAYEAAA